MTETTAETVPVVETPEDFRRMPEEYQELAIHQMMVHTEGELSGADDYLQVFFPIAPSAYERKVCCERAAEEIDHYMIGAAVLNDLGINTDHMLDQKLLERGLYASPAIHNIKTWTQRALFSYIGENAVLDHIEEMAKSSYRPWANSFGKVIRDEHVHVGHGRRIVREMLRDEAGREEVQQTLNAMWPFVLSLFGSDKSRRSPEYLRWGLRQRTNAEARDFFVARIVPELNRMGLTVPDQPATQAPAQPEGPTHA
ncbi:Phenylacetic acid catabolic protein [Streptomyces chattanoogensis]|uniref:Phenylacetic acid catabolic protein n=1 Tax=Streptomyces chattanoogensis TaxID=66876 RepID=UPI003696CF38